MKKQTIIIMMLITASVLFSQDLSTPEKTVDSFFQAVNSDDKSQMLMCLFKNSGYQDAMGQDWDKWKIRIVKRFVKIKSTGQVALKKQKAGGSVITLAKIVVTYHSYGTRQSDIDDNIKKDKTIIVSELFKLIEQDGKWLIYTITDAK